ncbi:MAG: cysteine peptidase family C39 domain-containing protein [Planctomycetota bacterium]
MRWLLCLSALVTFAGALALGRWLGREREQEAGRRRALWTVGLCLLVVLARLLVPLSLELKLALATDWYALLRPWWPAPFALCLLGAGAGQLEAERARRGLLVFAALLVVVAAHPLVRTALFDPKQVIGTIGADGVCVQTTDFTCGAAAATTLLAAHGIQASEREMAQRCWTNALTGTDVFCVVRGLRQKLAGSGRTVRVDVSRGGLEGLHPPAMVTVRYGLFLDHWVVVRALRPGVVEVGDPLHGVRQVPEAEFLRDWRGVSVSAPRLEEVEGREEAEGPQVEGPAPVGSGAR